jgi:cell division protein FtsI (penicillin-binding protein 3)
MKRPERTTIVHGALVLFALALIGKAAHVQLYRGDYWARQGRSQHYASSDLPAPRGRILDETGEVLVESRELTKIRVAPGEVRDRAALARLMRAAHVDPKWIARATDPSRKWVEIPTPFLPEDIAAVAAVRGVYPQSVMDRVYATSAGIRRITGRVNPRTGKAIDGIELSMDDELSGDTMRVRVPRDKSGHKMDLPSDVPEPKAGDDITLTINRGLQDICEHALADAVDSLGATGGDIVVMNPHTGEVLAMASRRVESTAFANTAVGEPYEPGSTLKPFVAAALLDRHLARPDEMMYLNGGEYELDGRVIHDDHEADSLSLADVIKYSSNIGIVKFSARMTPRQKYETLRNIGLGTSTTIPLPGESSGLLYAPVRWTKQSEASVMMGYEVLVTPLQLATAYSAIANGGELLEPQIIKEIRSADGTVLYHAKRRVVRRVMTPGAARTLRGMLRDVVEGGTSTRVELATIDVAGKSGTARRARNGRYVPGAYTASFVGLFPSDQPQYVVLAKLDNPQKTIYGGVAAGGVTNVVLRAALAARDAALDLHELSSVRHEPRPDTSPAGRRRKAAKARADSVRRAASPLPVAAVPVDTDPRTSASYVVKLPAKRHLAPPVVTVRPIPDVSGLTLRAAVRVLHGAGFRVQLVGGTTIETTPAAGTSWMPGRVVKLSGGG